MIVASLGGTTISAPFAIRGTIGTTPGPPFPTLPGALTSDGMPGTVSDGGNE